MLFSSDYHFKTPSSVEGRCNGTVECLSGNDEIDCKIAIMPESYSNKLPPPSMKGQIEVNVSVIVFDILELNENENKIRFVYKIYLFWKDSRVEFYNLREDKARNILSKTEFSQIWKPSLSIQDTNIYHREINEAASILITKESNSSRAAPNAVLLNSLIYEGKQSIIQHKEKIR